MLQASFSLSGDKHASEIKLDDPDFWEKWAKRAELDVDQLKNRVRKRTVELIYINNVTVGGR